MNLDRLKKGAFIKIKALNNDSVFEIDLKVVDIYWDKNNTESMLLISQFSNGGF